MRWIGRHGPFIPQLQLSLNPFCQYNDWRTYNGSAVVLLSQLQILQHLDLTGPGDFLNPARHLYVLEFLPKLLALKLQFKASQGWSETSLAPLKYLTCLISLDIKISYQTASFLVSPESGHLTQLKQLTLNCAGQICEGCSNSGLFKTVSKFINLTQVSLHGMLDNIPAELASLAQLQRFHIQMSEYCSHRSATLAFPAFIAFCANLQTLSLPHLSPASAEGWWGICRSLVFLPGLKSLTVNATDLHAVPLHDWALSSRLLHLNPSGCDMTRMPSALCQLPNLRCLELVGSTLTELDGGPYRRNLGEMTIRWDGVTKGSKVLSEALHLYEFSVRCRSSDECQQGGLARLLLQGLLPANCNIHIFADDYDSSEPSSPFSAGMSDFDDMI